ncbi:MAG: type II secretion system F family protein [Candidatus Aenigmarchaeota archaeon]|nr:type II secretion system F family protein [Candidatus Aenigmarchaeota archaeon]MCX8179558.1 type II secretion system F family protein [Candidatus Aenigmarchaeota archaeon]
MTKFYGKLALSLTSWIVDSLSEIFKPINKELPKAGIKTPKRVYNCIIVLNSFIAYIICLIGVIVFHFMFKINPYSFLVYLIFLPLIAALFVFLIGYFYPINIASSRRAKIETNLPFVVAHMGAIASSGIPPSAIFKLLSKFKEYDVLAEEMEKIVVNIEVFGLDPVSAMKEVAKRTPSEKFKQILLGLASTIESGGSVKTYLKNMSEQTLFHWRMRRERYIQQLSTSAEFYTGILIAAPLFLISLFSIMNMIEPNLGGIGILQLMKLSIYVLIPILNIMFLIFLSTTQVEI